MNEAFERLRNNLRHNHMFDGYITYIAKLEYGLEKGWHYHVIFFFDGHKVNADITRSQQIGEYWVNIITYGKGVYRSANMEHLEYKCYAAGTIHYWDTDKIIALKEKVAKYLAKQDTEILNGHWKDAMGRNIRCFRTGQYTPKTNNIGRPRFY